MDKGLFFTFEGIDGAGKSTQLKFFQDWLKEQGLDVLIVREPGGTVIGEKIREVLLNKKNGGMVPMTELLLFEAARAQITEEVIKPSLALGKVVICDRFYDSTYAYQGYARDMGSETVTYLNNLATAGLSPDMTFVLDIDVDFALERRVGRGEAADRMEALGIAFQKEVRKGYLEAAGKEPERIKVVDASGTPEEIFESIKKLAKEVL